MVYSQTVMNSKSTYRDKRDFGIEKAFNCDIDPSTMNTGDILSWNAPNETFDAVPISGAGLNIWELGGTNIPNPANAGDTLKYSGGLWTAISPAEFYQTQLTFGGQVLGGAPVWMNYNDIADGTGTSIANNRNGWIAGYDSTFHTVVIMGDTTVDPLIEFDFYVNDVVVFTATLNAWTNSNQGAPTAGYQRFPTSNNIGLNKGDILHVKNKTFAGSSTGSTIVYLYGFFDIDS